MPPLHSSIIRVAFSIALPIWLLIMPGISVKMTIVPLMSNFQRLTARATPHLKLHKWTKSLLMLLIESRLVTLIIVNIQTSWNHRDHSKCTPIVKKSMCIKLLKTLEKQLKVAMKMSWVNLRISEKERRTSSIMNLTNKMFTGCNQLTLDKRICLLIKTS